jgi:prepilin-type N-terminal cleavage/methylation domain-containing protein
MIATSSRSSDFIYRKAARITLPGPGVKRRRLPLCPGFTLVELLVVIGIIAILAGILLPSLASAKDRASDATCINNLRQISIGVRLYQDDFATRFPPAFLPKLHPQSREVIGQLDTRWTIGGRMPPSDEHAQQEYADTEFRPLNRYVPAYDSFRCPKDKGVTWQNCGCPEMRSESKWSELGCSYHYNAGGLTGLSNPPTVRQQKSPDDGLGGKPEDWPPEPSKYILIHEPPARPWGCPGKPAVWVQWHRAQGESAFTDPARAPQKFISPVLFVDGHVRIHNFSKALTTDPLHPYEPTPDWIWYRPIDEALANF